MSKITNFKHESLEARNLLACENYYEGTVAFDLTGTNQLSCALTPDTMTPAGATDSYSIEINSQELWIHHKMVQPASASCIAADNINNYVAGCVDTSSFILGGSVGITITNPTATGTQSANCVFNLPGTGDYLMNGLAGSIPLAADTSLIQGSTVSSSLYGFGFPSINSTSVTSGAYTIAPSGSVAAVGGPTAALTTLEWAPKIFAHFVVCNDGTFSLVEAYTATAAAAAGATPASVPVPLTVNGGTSFGTGFVPELGIAALGLSNAKAGDGIGSAISGDYITNLNMLAKLGVPLQSNYQDFKDDGSARAAWVVDTYACFNALAVGDESLCTLVTTTN